MTEHIFLYSLVVFFLGIISIGVYITTIAYSNKLLLQDSWLATHIATLKWLGPTVIGVGLLFLSWTFFVIYNSSKVVTSNFGFKFY